MGQIFVSLPSSHKKSTEIAYGFKNMCGFSSPFTGEFSQSNALTIMTDGIAENHDQLLMLRLLSITRYELYPKLRNNSLLH